MSSPTNGIQSRPRPATAAPATSSSSSGFGAAATPPDHATTALQSAVAVLRGQSPKPKTEDVLEMANAFLTFLKSNGPGRPTTGSS